MSTIELPQVLPDAYSPIVRLERMHRSKLETIWLNIMRQLYMDSATFISPLLLPWSADGYETPEQRYLFVEISGTWGSTTGTDLENTVNRLPAILVDLGDLQFDPYINAATNTMMALDMEHGEMYMSRRVTGSVVFLHKAGTKSEVQLYADNTFDLFDAFSLSIRSAIGLEKLAARAIFKPTMRNEAPEEWECRVQADFQYQDVFVLQTEAPKLKQISIVTGLPGQNITMTQ